MINMNESYTKTIENKNKLIKKNDIISALICLLLLVMPAEIQATTQKSKNNIKNIIELNDTTNLLDKMNQKFWITLPSQYNENLKSFISNSNTLNYEAAAQFTENFISEQMSQDWWVSEENQYLFIRCAIYYILTNQELYDWSDWNEQRYNEYEIAFEYFLNCEEIYKTKLKELIENEQQRAKDDAQRAKDDAQRAKDDAQRAKDDVQRAKDDAQRAKDDAQRAKDDAQRAKDDAQRAKDDAQRAKDDVMKTDSISLKELTDYYLSYQQDPNSATQEELNEIRNIAENLIQSCIKYWIDYKQILSPEVRKFYWIE